MEKRHASRTALLDAEGQVAIINVHKHGYYKIPGGGIDADEDSLAAARREATEESGCDVEIIADLGHIETALPGWQMYDISDGFLARVRGEKSAPNYEDYEQERGFDIEWHDLDKAIQLIEHNTTVADPDAARIQARDLEFLKRAKEYLATHDTVKQARYSIKEASQKLGVKPQSLRRLCNSGLIPQVKRTHSGYRILNESQLDLASILISMKQAGFTSAEIRQYSRLYRQGESTLAERTAILTTRKRQLWQEITDRQKAIDFIERQEEQLKTKTSAL